MSDRPVVDATIQAVLLVASRIEASDLAPYDFLPIVYFAVKDVQMAIVRSIARAKFDKITLSWSVMAGGRSYCR